eukprot:gnl/Hemi2/2063_TR738_c0_g1_i1.p1 gnl/Hemi2/2063_TR738_c0_g1~~gnl/Hemi2/2063_TR738_c0_g1_i1.p1  ORF type:complete len:209 (+),score=40.86 gnl/Hemi2/2063_TR738_c0_g1_i1:133-759(+)
MDALSADMEMEDLHAGLDEVDDEYCQDAENANLNTTGRGRESTSSLLNDSGDGDESTTKLLPPRPTGGIVMESPTEQQQRKRPKPVSLEPSQWSTGIFSFLSDPGYCVCGLFCPCAVGGVTMSKLDRGCCVPPCATYLCLWPCMGPIRRNRIRREYNIEGTCSEDVMTWLLLPLCAVCQEAREYDIRMMKAFEAFHKERWDMSRGNRR